MRSRRARGMRASTQIDPTRYGSSAEAVCERSGGRRGAGGAAGDADLVVDVLHVPLDGAHAHHQLGGDRVIRTPLGKQSQDLPFAGSQARALCQGLGKRGRRARRAPRARPPRHERRLHCDRAPAGPRPTRDAPARPRSGRRTRRTGRPPPRAPTAPPPARPQRPNGRARAELLHEAEPCRPPLPCPQRPIRPPVREHCVLRLRRQPLQQVPCPLQPAVRLRRAAKLAAIERQLDRQPRRSRLVSTLTSKPIRPLMGSERRPHCPSANAPRRPALPAPPPSRQPRAPPRTAPAPPPMQRARAPPGQTQATSRQRYSSTEAYGDRRPLDSSRPPDLGFHRSCQDETAPAPSRPDGSGVSSLTHRRFGVPSTPRPNGGLVQGRPGDGGEGELRRGVQPASRETPPAHLEGLGHLSLEISAARGGRVGRRAAPPGAAEVHRIGFPNSTRGGFVRGAPSVSSVTRAVIHGSQLLRVRSVRIADQLRGRAVAAGWMGYNEARSAPEHSTWTDEYESGYWEYLGGVEQLGQYSVWSATSSSSAASQFSMWVADTASCVPAWTGSRSTVTSG